MKTDRQPWHNRGDLNLSEGSSILTPLHLVAELDEWAAEGRRTESSSLSEVEQGRHRKRGASSVFICIWECVRSCQLRADDWRRWMSLSEPGHVADSSGAPQAAVYRMAWASGSCARDKTGQHHSEGDDVQSAALETQHLWPAGAVLRPPLRGQYYQRRHAAGLQNTTWLKPMNTWKRRSHDQGRSVRAFAPVTKHQRCAARDE